MYGNSFEFLGRFARNNLFQFLREILQVGAGETSKLSAMEFQHRSIKLLENFEPISGDARFYDTAIFGLTLTSDQGALLHAIQEPCHIRIVGDHAVADGLAGEAFGLGAAKNTQHVELRASKTTGFHKLLRFEAQPISGSDQSDEG